MTKPAWNRGDGEPDLRRLDEALDRILGHRRPVEVILFGSATRGELQDSSEFDLLVVLGDGDSAEPERMCFYICEANGRQAWADVAVTLEREIREAAGALPAPCTPRPRRDSALPPTVAAGLRAQKRPSATVAHGCPAFNARRPGAGSSSRSAAPGLWTPSARRPRVPWIPRCARAPHRPQGTMSIYRP